MDRTRAAAWASGASATILALFILYQARDGRSAIPTAADNLFFVVPIAFGAAMALALPDRPLARAAFAGGAGLHLLSFYGFVVVFWPPWGDDGVDVFLRTWIELAIAIVLFLASIAWAARPSGRTTIAARILFGLVLVFFFYDMRGIFSAFGAADWVGIGFATLLYIPYAAVALGLQPACDAPPTNL